MPSFDCPNCDGSGYTTEASGKTVVCPVRDVAGSMFNDGETSDAE